MKSCSFLFNMWFLLVLVVSKILGISGCVEEERNALLDLKSAFDHPNGSSMPSWSYVDEKSDCCTWERVGCNTTTKRVIQLSLGRISVSKSDGWYLNASMFLRFEELKYVDLSHNLLRGWIGNRGFKELSKLKNLQVLDLSWNRFTSLKFLGSLVSLKVLYLNANQLDQSCHTEGNSQLSEFTGLVKLEVLDLSHNSLNGSIPPSIWTLSSLKVLLLRDCKLNGALSAQGICKLKKIQELDLSLNGFKGKLPSCLTNLTSILRLDLFLNHFQGHLPPSLFSSLSSLEYLSLSYNLFDGHIFLSSFSNNTKLKDLDIVSYNNRLKIETEYPNWVPKFQLKSLRLVNCTLNNGNGALPSFLSSQHDLEVLDLSHNTLVGQVPTWLLENNTRLRSLRLMNNSVVGPLLLASTVKYRYVVLFDISLNNIQGEIPLNIGESLPNLHSLNMSKNALHGKLPKSLGDMTGLHLLDLSNNNLSGEIPEHLFMGCTSLVFLKLSNNVLNGLSFSERSNLTELRALLLDNNHFNGEISHGLAKTTKLEMLGIGNNLLSGTIPNWIGDLSNLKSLVMSKNYFHGPIPAGFCNLNELRFLDLSNNNLTGIIPSCLNSSLLKYVHLQRNGFTGPIPSVLVQSTSLVTLDLRDNKFSGKIPNSIYVVVNLRVLLLRRNLLQGPIPIQLCQLSKLGLLDLSHNDLSGSIPSCISNISFGRSKTNDGAFSQDGLEGTLQITLDISFRNQIHIDLYIADIFGITYEHEEVEFITKSRTESYMGNILYFMSGMDLSWNTLTGRIPKEMGGLSDLHTLNLSHNLLTGSIPEQFSNLLQIESLDLSHNRLSGMIPPELTGLTSLAVFTIAHNNLSGRTPDVKNQFITFSERSYEGNSLLCGPPLPKSCTTTKSSSSMIPSKNSGDDEGFIDSFLVSFAVSYALGLFGFTSLLYLNSHCLKAISKFIDLHIIGVDSV